MDHIGAESTAPGSGTAAEDMDVRSSSKSDSEVKLDEINAKLDLLLTAIGISNKEVNDGRD